MLPRDLNGAKISSCLLLCARAGSSWSVTIPRGEQRGAERRCRHAAQLAQGDKGFEPWVGWTLGSELQASSSLRNPQCASPTGGDIHFQTSHFHLLLSV